MVVPSKSTGEHSYEYVGAEKQTTEKVRFRHLSLQNSADIKLLHALNDISFVIVVPFSLFVCKLARVGGFG